MDKRGKHVGQVLSYNGKKILESLIAEQPGTLSSVKITDQTLMGREAVKQSYGSNGATSPKNIKKLNV